MRPVSRIFQYEVIQPLPGVTKVKVLPWFGQPGMGTQFQLPNSVQWYIDNGYLKGDCVSFWRVANGRFITWSVIFRINLRC
ncbi:TNT domain-containing protein [Pseudomonas sp. ADAK2 TE3594]